MKYSFISPQLKKEYQIADSDMLTQEDVGVLVSAKDVLVKFMLQRAKSLRLDIGNGVFKERTNLMLDLVVEIEAEAKEINQIDITLIQAKEREVDKVVKKS